MTDRIALISDVHGNLTALDAVLAHISAAGITRIFNLGDLVGKGPRPAEVVDRCREVCEVTLLGNWDIGAATPDDPLWPPGIWHRAGLGEDRLAYLASLPGSVDFALSGHQVRLFHASQAGVHHRVYETAPPEQRRAMFDNTEFTGFGPVPDIVGYGDIHYAYTVAFEQRVLFNAGSVGNALDLPLACYVVLTGNYGDSSPAPWSLEFVRLPYDVEAELRAARASGMPDFEHYATELRTAVYQRRS